MTGFKLNHLTKKFAQRAVLADLSLQVEAGSFVSLVGASGSGKSTLLRLIAELEAPTSGSLEIRKNTRKAFVFQDSRLLAWRNVCENVHLPFELGSKALLGMNEEQKSSRVQEALRKVSLEKFQDLFPHELSGGMKMRTALARALVLSPELLLLDEPFSALDEIIRWDLQTQLRQLWQKQPEDQKMTCLFVTHNIQEALLLSNRIVVLAHQRIQLDLMVDLPEERSEECLLLPSFQLQATQIRQALA